MESKLTSQEIDQALKGLNAALASPWEVRDGKLHKDFVFRDFVQAFGFMSEVAILAQEMDHHPDWTNTYKRVGIDLTTHSAGGITELDFRLAGKIEGLLRGTAIS